MKEMRRPLTVIISLFIYLVLSMVAIAMLFSSFGFGQWG